MPFSAHDQIRRSLAEYITPALVNAGATATMETVYRAFTAVPDAKMGQLALPMFLWAKELKQNPAALSKALFDWSAGNEAVCPYLLRVQNAGPYLNFFYQHAAVAKDAITSMLNGSYYQQKLGDHFPRTMIEFSQPNTHKELHVGHMRNLCLGDSLIKLLRYAGYDIVASTFPGDVGTHVAKCLWYLKYHYQGEVPTERKGAWLGRMYSTANNKLEDERGTPHEESNRKQLTEILAQLEKKQGEFYELWKETRQWSVDLMNEVYAWADVKFDVWYWESEVDSDSVKLAREYQEKGLFKLDNGAVGADLSEYGLGFCLLIKTDGNGLYATKDVELARRKFEKWKIEKSIYVVDKRQEHHFKQVFKVLELMGFPHAKDCLHLQYDFVELPDGAMSSRKGNIVALQSLIEEMVAMIKQQFLSRYENEWSKEEIEKTAQTVARGAIKYGMLKIDPAKKIVFDMKEWLKLDGESGPYAQYAFARINSMLGKMNYQSSMSQAAQWELMTTSQEEEVIRLLPRLNTVIQEACEQYRPSLLTAYLYDLARAYNAFYAECPVASSQAGLKEARLCLSAAVAANIKQGLALLGIEAPEKM